MDGDIDGSPRSRLWTNDDVFGCVLALRSVATSASSYFQPLQSSLHILFSTLDKRCLYCLGPLDFAASRDERIKKVRSGSSQ